MQGTCIGPGALCAGPTPSLFSVIQVRLDAKMPGTVLLRDPNNLVYYLTYNNVQQVRHKCERMGLRGLNVVSNACTPELEHAKFFAPVCHHPCR